MIDLSIRQALFEGNILRARSADFLDAWNADVEVLQRQFGAPPGGTCAEALLAQPFATRFVAIVRVCWPLTHLLVLGRKLYDELHDPFAIAESFAPDWTARGALPELAWPPEPLPMRTVAMLDSILQHGEGPFLLGAAQALVDGGRIVLQRPAPDAQSLRDLWALLPDAVRRTIWPNTFAFNTDGFDLLVVATIPEGGFPGYLNEDQAHDYPDSRYERRLQIAIESCDQPMLDRLLSRKSTSEMIRLALLIIAVIVGATLLAGILT